MNTSGLLQSYPWNPYFEHSKNRTHFLIDSFTSDITQWWCLASNKGIKKFPV